MVIGTEGIRNVMVRSRLEDIIYKITIFWTTKKMTSYKGHKVRSLMNHFNQSFSNSISNDDFQRIDEHMVKLKGLSIMKQ